MLFRSAVTICPAPAAADSGLAARNQHRLARNGAIMHTSFASHTAAAVPCGYATRNPTFRSRKTSLLHFAKEIQMTIYILLFILLSTIWAAVEIGLVIRDNSRGKGKTTIDKGTRYFNFIAISAGITGAAILYWFSKFYFPGGRTNTIFFFGIAIMLIGMALRFWSVFTLGKSFRTTIETDQDQKIISHGPYKLVRHPSYSGLLLLFCGYGIALQNWLSLLVAVSLPLVALLYRIRIEEAALVSSFGSEYIEYQKRTKKLIPWVW